MPDADTSPIPARSRPPSVIALANVLVFERSRVSPPPPPPPLSSLSGLPFAPCWSMEMDMDTLLRPDPDPGGDLAASVSVDVLRGETTPSAALSPTTEETDECRCGCAAVNGSSAARGSSATICAIAHNMSAVRRVRVGVRVRVG